MINNIKPLLEQNGFAGMCHFGCGHEWLAAAEEFKEKKTFNTEW
jgi:hypothetical protein